MDDQANMDFDAIDEVAGESNAQRFKRVMNHRLSVAATRLRLIDQMFTASSANNYDFTEEQIGEVSEFLVSEVTNIIESATKVLAKRAGKALRKPTLQL